MLTPLVKLPAVKMQVFDGPDIGPKWSCDVLLIIKHLNLHSVDRHITCRPSRPHYCYVLVRSNDLSVHVL